MDFKISVELSHVCPLEEITDHAAELESRGFYRAWIPDTIVSPWEAWLAAGIIAQHTDGLNIGLGVMNPYTRHPVVVAQMAATMQKLSGGRLALSIGKGIERVLEKAGIDQQASAVQECITILRGLIAGERTSIAGQAFQIDAMRIRTPPLDKAVPIYLAAISPSSWEMAMRVADGVATIWNDDVADIRASVMATATLPTAALIPFSLSDEDFLEPWNRVSSFAELQERVERLKEAGIDEVIVAYRDIADLQAAARLME